MGNLGSALQVLRAERKQRLEVLILDVQRRRLENHLKLRMFIKAIGILSVASVGGPTARLHKSRAIRIWSEHAQKGFRVHGASAYFYIVRLLKNTTVLDPEMRERQNQILKIQTLGPIFKFYFSFQVVSKNSRVCRFRSV